MKTLFAYLFINCITISFLVSQEIPASIRQQIENYIEEQESEDLDIFELYENLQNYLSSPINLNSEEIESLQDLRLLTQFQIADLKDHIRKNGKLIALEELQSIRSFDRESINRILPFISVTGSKQYQANLKDMMFGGKNELYLKWRRILEDQAGYEQDNTGFAKYAGDQNRYFVKYKYNYESRFRYGFTLEKDSGEDFFKGSNKQGFDFMSAYVYMKDYSDLFKDIVIGDYTISMGQGLIIHNAFGAGKSAWVTDVKRGGRVIRPYNSINENFYFRGAAATLRPIKNVEWSIMGSMAKKDGSIDSTEFDQDEDFLISFLENGSHRTESEIAREKQLREIGLGSSIKYKRSNYYIGLNFLHQSFGAEYQFSDNKYQNTSLDYSYRFRNFHFFGEASLSLENQSTAHLHGLLIGLSKRANLALLYRDYSADYDVFRPRAFGESATNVNERGYYMGIELIPNTSWKIRMYADLWKNPTLRFRIDKPSTGREYLLRVDYLKKRKFNFYVQFQYEQKERNFSADEQELVDPDNRSRLIDFTKRYRLRIHFSNKLSKTLELRNRIEFSRFDHIDSHKGFMMYQDVIYRRMASPLRITGRFAVFDIEDTDARIYTYENDILYEFFIPAFGRGMGTRFYVNFRYDLTRSLVAEFRYAKTYFQDAVGISSGNELILGDTKTELKAQLIWKF